MRRWIFLLAALALAGSGVWFASRGWNIYRAGTRFPQESVGGRTSDSILFFVDRPDARLTISFNLADAQSASIGLSLGSGTPLGTQVLVVAEGGCFISKSADSIGRPHAQSLLTESRQSDPWTTDRVSKTLWRRDSGSGVAPDCALVGIIEQHPDPVIGTVIRFRGYEESAEELFTGWYPALRSPRGLLAYRSDQPFFTSGATKTFGALPYIGTPDIRREKQAGGHLFSLEGRSGDSILLSGAHWYAPKVEVLARGPILGAFERIELAYPQVVQPGAAGSDSLQWRSADSITASWTIADFRGETEQHRSALIAGLLLGLAATVGVAAIQLAIAPIGMASEPEKSSSGGHISITGAPQSTQDLSPGDNIPRAVSSSRSPIRSVTIAIAIVIGVFLVGLRRKKKRT